MNLEGDNKAIYLELKDLQKLDLEVDSSVSTS